MYGVDELTEVLLPRARRTRACAAIAHMRPCIYVTAASLLTRLRPPPQSEDEDLAADNPMTPEQIQTMLDRQIVLTRDLDDNVPSPGRSVRVPLFVPAT